MIIVVGSMEASSRSTRDELRVDTMIHKQEEERGLTGNGVDS